MLAQPLLHRISHVIFCSVQDPVQLGDFPHITWEYEDIEEHEEEHGELEEKEEESNEDEGGEESPMLRTSHINMTRSTGQRAQVDTTIGFEEKMGADVGAITQIPNTRDSFSPMEVQPYVEVEATQVMICAVPYKLRVREISDVFNQHGFGNKYLDVHMPQNTRRDRRNENIGCVFVTLRNRVDANEFRNFFNGFYFAGADGPCEVKFASAQSARPKNRRSKTKYGTKGPVAHP